MSALVIKQWKVDAKPIDSDKNYISITGREGGLIAWVLSLVGIDPVTTILVGTERIQFTSASLAGTASRMIPLEGVCSSYYGYHKPWKAAAGFIAAGLFLGGMTKSGLGFLALALIGIVVGVVYYFLNRELTLGFVENSGIVNGIRFKRSVIENIDIDQNQAKAVCVQVQGLIEAKTKR